MSSYPHGMFCWADLGTPVARGAKRFYTKLLGLTPNDMPMGPGPDDVYTMLQKQGKDCAALFQRAGAPASWQAYFAVNNVDETAETVRSLGGKLTSDPIDVFDAGRMVTASDPLGAHFAVWEAKRSIGAYVFGEPGAIGWAELMTGDTRIAADFYSRLFGWKATQQPHNEAYTVFKAGQDNAGGMMAISPEMRGMKSHWVVYFVVENCDRAVSVTQRDGGSIMKEAFDVPDTGRIAILKDPQGAGFSVIELRR